MSDIKLFGRVFIRGEIVAQTGLHIGGSGGSFSIGGVDNPVIINDVTGQPYVPGSSLKGKMRSLFEKQQGQTRGQRIGQSVIHRCSDEASYKNCPICNLFGITAESFNWPTRLVVRDVALTQESASELALARTPLQYTELKTEVAIDRVTSQASPRTFERVPAGAVFGPMELVYSVYQEQDIDWFRHVVDALALVQDDYLGGSGTRGSGQVVFRNLIVTIKGTQDYLSPHELGRADDLSQLIAGLGEIQAAMRSDMGV